MPTHMVNILEFKIEEVGPSEFHLVFDLQGERLLEYDRTFETLEDATLELVSTRCDIIKVLSRHCK